MAHLQNGEAIEDQEISGEEKLRLVSKLLQGLQQNAQGVTCRPEDVNSALFRLKVFARDPANAGPLFTSNGIKILTFYGFHHQSPTTSKAALQCLVNALLSEPKCRQIFVDRGVSVKAAERLKNPKIDDELLMSRLLFVASFGTTQSFAELVERHHLSEHINSNIAHHAKGKAAKPGQVQLTDQALTETLKLLINVTHHCPIYIPHFSKSVPNILKLLANFPKQSPPLRQPLSCLINTLLGLNLHELKKALGSSFMKYDLPKTIGTLIGLLGASLREYSGLDLENHVIPLLTLLSRLASEALPDTKAQMRKALVPPKKARLQELTVAPVAPAIHDAISGLIFELTENDPSFPGERSGAEKGVEEKRRTNVLHLGRGNRSTNFHNSIKGKAAQNRLRSASVSSSDEDSCPPSPVAELLDARPVSSDLSEYSASLNSSLTLDLNFREVDAKITSFMFDD